MRTAEECRRIAEEYEQLADLEQDEQGRRRLLREARQWRLIGQQRAMSQASAG